MKRSEAHEAFARRFATPTCQHVTLCECGTCGHVDWVQSTEADTFSVVVQPMHQPCSRCNQAYQRSPELVEWVLAVVRMQMEAR